MATHLYWRINITSTPSAYGTEVAELQFNSVRGGSTLCSGGTPLCNASDLGAVANAFDGNPADYWGATGFPSYIGYELPTAANVVEFLITCSLYSTAYAPGNFTLDYSDDGSIWTTVATYTGQTFTVGQTQTYEAGPSSYTQTVVAGAIIGGNAAITEHNKIYTQTVIGGFVSGGSASANGHVTTAESYTQTINGGSIFGGNVIVRFGNAILAITGIVIGGSAVQKWKCINPVLGGFISGGKVGWIRECIFNPSKGIVLGGTVTSAGIKSYVQLINGGVDLGGNVIPLSKCHNIVNGGMILGGAILNTTKFACAVSGGLVLGGLSILKIGSKIYAIYGLVTGGSSTEVRHHTYKELISGGDVIGGIPTLIISCKQPTLLGIVIGGEPIFILDVKPIIPILPIIKVNDATCLVFNTENEALSEYENYNFNSFAYFNGRYIGANGSGLFDLDGDDDNGSTIEAYFYIPRNFMENGFQKRPWNVYLTLKTDGDFSVKIRTDNGEEFDGLVMPSNGDGIENRRVKLSRRRKSSSWGIFFKNEDGSDFEVDAIDLNVEILTRRIA